MTRVLVTGGAGYIGSHVVLGLLDAGHAPVVVDDLSTGHRSAVPAGVPLLVGNAGDAHLIERAVREYEITAVMHFAGSLVMPESIKEPLIYYRNNTVNSHSLISVCVDLGVRFFVFSSTAAVYGSPKSLPVSETAETRPTTPYGWSKLMTEQMLNDVARVRDLRFAILRYFNVAGADLQERAGLRTEGATHLIAVACDVLLGLRPFLEIFGDDYPTPDGTGVRDYIHVSDLADAHIMALRFLENGGEACTLNCGYGHGYSVREVVSALENVSGRKLPVEVRPRRPGDVAAIVSQADRIRRTLGWIPRHDNLQTIVRSALDWRRRMREELS